MRKFISWMTVMAVTLSFGFSSCSDNKEDGPVETAAPELLTFGFNVANNGNTLTTDYVGVISTTDHTVTVTMPAFADKSSLVANFTVGEGNKVLVNGVTQESGVTANDFTAPVDYIISNADGSKNVKYTVTIEKAANYEWSEFARYNELVPYGDNAIMKINPVDNTPYIAFVRKEKDDNNKVVVIKNENGVFNYVGSKEGESDVVTSGMMDFTISNTGTLYYIYKNKSITEPVKYPATVMSFNGSSWSNVGQPYIAEFVPSKVQIGAIGSIVIAPMISNTNSGSFTKRVLYASIFNDNWTTGSLASVNINEVGLECLTTTDNAAYLYTISRTSYKYSVVEYKNGVWNSLRSDYLEEGATMAPVSMSDAASIVATNDGTVYLLTADDAETKNTKDMRFRILKYSPDSKEWTLVGGTTMASVKANESHISAKIAVAPDGTPFFAYTDYTGDKLAKVQYFDNETKQWSAPVAVSAGEASYVNISFCDNGEAYISYVSADNSIVLVKYAAKK